MGLDKSELRSLLSRCVLTSMLTSNEHTHTLSDVGIKVCMCACDEHTV